MFTPTSNEQKVITLIQSRLGNNPHQQQLRAAALTLANYHELLRRETIQRIGTGLIRTDLAITHFGDTALTGAPDQLGGVVDTIRQEYSYNATTNPMGVALYVDRPGSLNPLEDIEEFLDRLIRDAQESMQNAKPQNKWTAFEQHENQQKQNQNQEEQNKQQMLNQEMQNLEANVGTPQEPANSNTESTPFHFTPFRFTQRPD